MTACPVRVWPPASRAQQNCYAATALSTRHRADISTSGDLLSRYSSERLFDSAFSATFRTCRILWLRLFRSSCVGLSSPPPLSPKVLRHEDPTAANRRIVIPQRDITRANAPRHRLGGTDICITATDTGRGALGGPVSPSTRKHLRSRHCKSRDGGRGILQRNGACSHAGTIDRNRTARARALSTGNRHAARSYGPVAGGPRPMVDLRFTHHAGAPGARSCIPADGASARSRAGRPP